jgi:methionyl-tRNA formyltransferase
LERRVLAFNPYPIAQTWLDGQPLRVWRARAERESVTAAPGTVLREDSAGIVVAAGSGVLLSLTEVQLPRRPAITGRGVSDRPPTGWPTAGRA